MDGPLSPLPCALINPQNLKNKPSPCSVQPKQHARFDKHYATNQHNCQSSLRSPASWLATSSSPLSQARSLDPAPLGHGYDADGVGEARPRLPPGDETDKGPGFEDLVLDARVEGELEPCLDVCRPVGVLLLRVEHRQDTAVQVQLARDLYGTQTMTLTALFTNKV